MKTKRPLLLAEDNEVDAETVRRSLQDLKVKNPLERAKNGEEALAYLRDGSKEKPCLILLDLKMPRMDGIEFLKVVKQDEKLRRIPVVVFTTSMEEQDKVNSFNLSVAGYVIKPVGYKQFIEVMKTIGLSLDLERISGSGMIHHLRRRSVTTIAKEKARLQSGVVKVLLLEDNEVDAQWVERALKNFGKTDFQIEWVKELEKAIGLTQKASFDIIIADLKVPDGFGLEVYEALYRAAPHTPIILLTGTLEEEKVALEAIQKGAQDYLFKGQASPQVLLRSLVYALERHKLLSMRDHFVNIVSHELRSPLAAIRMSAGDLLEGLAGPLNAQQKEYLAIFLKSIDRLHRTANELLDLARMEAGRTPLKRSRFDLAAMVHEIKKSFEKEAHAKGLVLKTKMPEGRVEIDADPDKIARVLTNLLDNAVKFTEKGAVEITVKDLEDSVFCSVSDTGTGISSEDLPKVFNKFEQFGRKDKSQAEGSGLGLSITKQIIDMHGGSIRVESELGKGTAFHFSLPKVPFHS